MSTVNPAKLGLSVVATPWFSALTEAREVHSLSISAPAAVTLAVSVTSALASMPSSLVLSAEVKFISVSPPSPTLYVVSVSTQGTFTNI